MFTTLRSGILAYIYAATLVPAAALAQQPRDTPKAGTEGSADTFDFGARTSGDTRANRAIVVTGVRDESSTVATGLPLSIAETPQSVTVVDRTRIEDFNLNSVNEVLAQTPGVAILNVDSNRTNFLVRGFPIRNFLLDGVPTIYQVSGYENSAVGDVAIYDRIEVVRGAAALFTGIGDPSATVNLVRKRAPREADSYINMMAGSFDYYRIEADIGAPITDDGSVRARAVGAYTYADSYIARQHDNIPVLYGTIEADLTPTTSVRAGIDYLETDSRESGWGSVPVLFSDGTPTDLPTSYSTAANWTYWNRQLTTIFAGVEQKIGDDWLAKINYNRRDGFNTSALFAAPNGYPNQDGTGLPAPWSFYGEVDQKEDAFDASLGGVVSLFGREHEVLVGGNYFKRDFSILRSAFASDMPDGFPTSGFPNILRFDGAVPRPQIIKDDTPASTQDIRQMGGYGVVRLNPADWLKVIGGVRYTDFRTEQTNFLADGTVNGSNPGSVNETDRLTPYGGIVIDVVPTVSAYASYAQLFTPVTARDANNDILPPTTGTNYEAGLKATPLGDGFVMSLAGFYSEQKDVVQTDPNAVPNSLPDGGTPAISVPGISSRGVEAEVQGEPVRGLRLFASYTYTDSENADGDPFNTFLPQHIARAYGTYLLPGDRLTVGGGVSFQSDIYDTGPIPSGAFDDSDNAVLAPGRVEQDAFALVNLLARYKLSEQATVGINVDNLFDKTYYSSLRFAFGGAGGFYGSPRTVMGNIRFRF